MSKKPNHNPPALKLHPRWSCYGGKSPLVERRHGMRSPPFDRHCSYEEGRVPFLRATATARAPSLSSARRPAHLLASTSRAGTRVVLFSRAVVALGKKGEKKKSRE